MSTSAPALNETHERPTVWSKAPPRTVDETLVANVTTELREKDDWRKKALDPEIMAKWKAEAIKEFKFSESMAQYLEDELKYEAGLWHNEELGIESTGVLGVVRSDKLVKDDVIEKLRLLSSELESGPEKDWHPESDETVLDVVHPSLYCLVDDHTRLLGEDEEALFPEDSRDLGRWFGKLPDIHASDESLQRSDEVPVAHTCQWLPADFQVDEQGKVKALSYINNLHPDRSKPTGKLYDVIEATLGAFIPMFEATFAEYQLEGFRIEFRKGSDNAHWIEEFWNPAAPAEVPVSELATTAEDRTYLNTDGEGAHDKSADRIEYARREYWTENREWVRIPVEKFEPVKINPISLKNRRLQVIVKMATIHLDPKKPEYEGGAWHVEGTHREKISATGILYFDQENIEESGLKFRGSIDTSLATEEIPYEQNEFDAIMELYGFGTDSETSQVLGKIRTKPGRSIAFPNGLQHQVAPFKLADPSKPGFRKILAFFLVDPLEKVISTARVPPQQYDWMRTYYNQVFASLPPTVPTEIRQIILAHAAPAAIVSRPAANRAEDGQPQRQRPRLNADKDESCGMSIAQAREYRLALMRERAKQAVHIEEENEQGFSFCEH
ncbi:unnamed protein product [Tilletia controversa]|uniref:Uncharacterized protein n=1 Tax=Tilletia controversa TaxID=13291 RepID=A0A8X7MZB4_9BASI|nr:hypothetical protein CF328_g1418 [Tilletia controversa]KAE8253322.1 hypothetical protein A4X06_0g1536 [Tilletia controversa]CAD6939588.1 unnamed protein product [Tilletia controversa]CAD6940089.1 unnamed protein product [Tilletia controversa]CAD6958990.1 unnamed protein product [Tilletia controversa]